MYLVSLFLIRAVERNEQQERGLVVLFAIAETKDSLVHAEKGHCGSDDYIR